MKRGGAVEKEPEAVGETAGDAVETAGVVGETAGDVVELTYRLEAADYTSALEARLRVSRLGWLFRWVPLVVGCVAVAQIALRIAGVKEHVSLSASIMMLCISVVLPLSPRLAGRRIAQYSQRQGVLRATVTETGVTLASDTTNLTVTWQAQPRYRETSRLFVLISGDGNATGFTPLPKHGLPDRADVDRLRALLDRHLTRC
ncbi:YcxB family protein [Streptomyces sp. NPDC059575]|uniref:YcxB family protein n=1 Tax=Streptomyces sp. NPDC059575 TaxID=3346872 RepID=UPI003699E3BB